MGAGLRQQLAELYAGQKLTGPLIELLKLLGQFRAEQLFAIVQIAGKL